MKLLGDQTSLDLENVYIINSWITSEEIVPNHIKENHISRHILLSIKQISHDFYVICNLNLLQRKGAV